MRKAGNENANNFFKKLISALLCITSTIVSDNDGLHNSNHLRGVIPLVLF